MTNTKKEHETAITVNPEINYLNDSVPAEFHFIETLEKRLYGASCIASILGKNADAVIQKIPSIIAQHEEYGLLQLLKLELSKLDDELIAHISAMNEYFEKNRS